MEKLVYLLGSSVEPNALREALVGPIVNDLLAVGLVELEVYVADQTGHDSQPIENAMGPEGLTSASVSLWLDSARCARTARGCARRGQRPAG